MVRWRFYLAMAVAALSARIAGAQVDVPLQLQVQQLQLQEGQLPQGVIIIDGQLILNGQAAWQPIDVNLPIVNDGFANDRDVKGPIKPLIDALKSTQFIQREDATRAMLRLPPARLAEVVEALSRETDAEAIERLTQVAGHLFLKPRTLLKTKPSLLGVWYRQSSLCMLGLKFKMDPVKLAPQDTQSLMTVMVTELQPGYPAMQTLRDGDRIVAIAGIGFPPDVPLNDRGYFQSRVQALWPGRVIPMTILRDGNLLELGVETSGLPLQGADSPDAMVAMRQAALTGFLQTLKTGDKSQALLPILPNQTPQPQVIILRSGWGDVLVPANAEPAPRQ